MDRLPRWYRARKMLCRLGLHRWRPHRIHTLAHFATASIRHERCARFGCPAARSEVIRHAAW